MLDPHQERARLLTRRHFFSRLSTGIGIPALATLLNEELLGEVETPRLGGLPGLPHFPPTAKRVIYLFMSGAPSQMDLFDYKTRLNAFQGTELPDSIRM